MKLLDFTKELSATYLRQSSLPKTYKEQVSQIKENNYRSHYWNAKKNQRIGFYYSEKNKQYHLYRSSYELVAYILLEHNDDVVRYESETVKIPYKYRNRTHNYIVDLVIHFKNGIKMLAEVKPKSQVNLSKNKAKFKALKEYSERHDYKWEILTEKNLNIDNPVIRKCL
jgi:hypothetical protein